MRIPQLIALLQALPDPGMHVLLKVGKEWVDITGVKATGEHRNGITFATTLAVPDEPSKEQP